MGIGPLTHRHFLLYSPSWSREGPSPERLCNLSKVTQPGSGRASSNPNPASSALETELLSQGAPPPRGANALCHCIGPAFHSLSRACRVSEAIKGSNLERQHRLPHPWGCGLRAGSHGGSQKRAHSLLLDLSGHLCLTWLLPPHNQQNQGTPGCHQAPSPAPAWGPMCPGLAL